MEITLQIGPIKTATTFLQHDIFEKIPGLNVSFDVLWGSLRDDKKNIICNEHLAGVPYYPGEFEKRFIVADKLKRMFPDAKIILGHRVEKSWVKSMYTEYVRQGGVLYLDDFYEQCCDKRFFNGFDDYVSYLKTLFSEVYVYEFKQLKEDPYAFVEGICNFLGVAVPVFDPTPHNISYSDFQTHIVRSFNMFFKSEFNASGRFNRNVKINPSDLLNCTKWWKWSGKMKFSDARQ